MDFTAIKKYPSQISTAFKRFPLASALAIFTFYAFATNCELAPSFSSHSVRPFVWLSIYPIAAMLIAIATTLFQESQKSTSNIPQLITSGTWLVVSAALTAIFNEDESSTFYFVSTVALVYIAAIFGLFFAPFWKQKDENGFWNFLQKNIKALIIAVIVTTVLLGAIEGLILGFAGLFDSNFDEKVYFYTFLFCACTVLPVLYFTGIPSIDECIEETPSLNKFATSTIRFLFIPVLAIGLLLFYAYIVKFIIQWDMPEGVVSAFVSGFMIYMIALVTAMYPSHLAAGETIEKRLLKIFPAACIPLVILKTIDIVTILRNNDIEEEFLYLVAVNIYFYAVLAILLIDKVKRKFRYIALTFCVLFFICTDSPINAPRITRLIWLNSIENALIEQGYTQFPLSGVDEKAFIEKLKKNKDENSKLIVSRINRLEDEDLAYYFSTKISSYNESEPEPESCCTDTTNADSTVTDSTEAFDSFEATISHSENLTYAVPKGAKEVAQINLTFADDHFEFLGDTLSFRITIEPDNKTKADSASTDSNTVKAKKKFYNFKVLKESLSQDTTRILKADGATIGLQYLDVSQWSETGRSLRIEGLLFIE
jgi:hypothetical protein